MSKAEVIAAICESTGLTESKASKILAVILNVMTTSLKTNGKIKIMNFGSFDVRNRNGRNVRNPVTREIMQIKAHKTPIFVPGKTLKNAVK